jgi:hypothetical protein
MLGCCHLRRSIPRGLPEGAAVAGGGGCGEGRALARRGGTWGRMARDKRRDQHESIHVERHMTPTLDRYLRTSTWSSEKGSEMRGDFVDSEGMFSYLTPSQRSLPTSRRTTGNGRARSTAAPLGMPATKSARESARVVEEIFGRLKTAGSAAEGQVPRTGAGQLDLSLRTCCVQPRSDTQPHDGDGPMKRTQTPTQALQGEHRDSAGAGRASTPRVSTHSRRRNEPQRPFFLTLLARQCPRNAAACSRPRGARGVP